MALISSKVLIFAHSFFLVVLNSCLLVTPASISESSLVFMLGEAMRLPSSPSFSQRSTPAAICAILFFYQALTDLLLLLTISQPKIPGLNLRSAVFGTLSITRFIFFFSLGAYIYLSKRVDWANTAADIFVGDPFATAVSSLDALKNRVVFTWAFVEMVTWFWIYITLRDEQREEMARAAGKQAEQEGGFN